MARVLAISSQVARGHVGLSAIVPALQRLGHDVIALPTILLSNHPAHRTAAGEQVSPDLLQRMLDALNTNGWLPEIDAILTGYLPSPAHVQFAVDAVRRVREHSARVRVLVDPVLGDEPKGIYINADAAARMRDDLMRLADITTPNAFELGWLASTRIGCANDAMQAARVLPPPQILATSVSEEDGKISNVLVDKGASEIFRADVPDQGKVPNGTGDLLSALYLGHCLRGASASEAFSLAVAGVDAAIVASVGQDELALAVSAKAWADPQPWPLRKL